MVLFLFMLARTLGICASSVRNRDLSPRISQLTGSLSSGWTGSTSFPPTTPPKPTTHKPKNTPTPPTQPPHPPPHKPTTPPPPHKHTLSPHLRRSSSQSLADSSSRAPCRWVALPPYVCSSPFSTLEPLRVPTRLAISAPSSVLSLAASTLAVQSCCLVASNPHSAKHP